MNKTIIFNFWKAPNEIDVIGKEILILGYEEAAKKKILTCSFNADDSKFISSAELDKLGIKEIQANMFSIPQCKSKKEIIIYMESKGFVYMSEFESLY